MQFEPNTIYYGDVLDVLKTMPDQAVNCVVTSPPYWGLRDYGTAKWEGGDEKCEHAVGGQVQDTKAPGAITTGQRPGVDASCCRKCGARRIDSQIGLEKTPEEYVAKMVDVFREVRRVLKDDGTLWLNLGDSYWGGKGQSGQAWSTEHTDRDTLQKPYHQITGIKETRPSDGKHPTIKPKDLVGIPWRVAFALQAEGWYLRQDIIWHKPNPMPESVTDRCTKAHEYIFLLSKSQKYYYDADVIKEPASYNTHERVARAKIDHKSNPNDKISGIRPRKLAPSGSGIKNNDSFDAAMEIMPEHRNKRSVWSVCTEAYPEAHYAAFPQDLIKPCILAGAPEQGIVLDPFMGSGTTALVSRDLNRRYVGIELNVKNKILIEKRLSQQRLEL